MKNEKKCMVCGRVIEPLELMGVDVDVELGYGSMYDGDILPLRFCCNCADAIMTNIIEMGNVKT